MADETVQTAPAPAATPAPASPASAAPPPPAVSSEPAKSSEPAPGEPWKIDSPEWREMAEGIVAKAEGRAPNGQFAPKPAAPTEKTPPAAKPAEKSATAAEPKTAAQQAKPAEPAEKQAIQAPVSWKAEHKARWNDVPDDLKAVIAESETSVRRVLSENGQKLKASEPIRQVVERHKDFLTNLQDGGKPVSEAEAFDRMLTAARRLASDAPAAIKWLADSYGVDLRQFTGGQQPAGEDFYVDPEVTTLKQTVARLEKQLSDFDRGIRANQERAKGDRRSQALQKVDAFRADKADWDVLETAIEAQLIALKRSGETMSDDEMLSTAYDRARWANPSTRQRLIEEQDKAREEKRKEDAAQAAADARRAPSMPRSANGATVPAAMGTLDERIEAIGRAVTARHGLS